MRRYPNGPPGASIDIALSVSVSVGRNDAGGGRAARAACAAPPAPVACLPVSACGANSSIFARADRLGCRIDGARSPQRLARASGRAARQQRSDLAGIDDLPRQLDLLRLPVRRSGRRSIADDDPVLVGRRAVLQRPQREALHRPGALAVRPAADFLVAVTLHGAIDRHAVPVLQHHARLERRVEAVADLGHDVRGRIRRADHLDQERQRRDLALERCGARVARVRIAQPRDGVRQLDVERVVAELVDLRAQDAQALHRIEPVARALERQVRVDALEHALDAVDQPQALAATQRARGQEWARQLCGLANPQSAFASSGARLPAVGAGGAPADGRMTFASAIPF